MIPAVIPEVSLEKSQTPEITVLTPAEELKSKDELRAEQLEKTTRTLADLAAAKKRAQLQKRWRKWGLSPDKDDPLADKQPKFYEILLMLNYLLSSLFKLRDEIRKIPDPRSGPVIYSMESIVIGAMLMMFLRIGSRLKFNQLVDAGPEFRATVKKLLGIDLPHGDTIQGVFKRMDLTALNPTLIAMVRIAIARGMFNKHRLEGRLIVAVDAVDIGSTRRDSKWKTTKVSKSGKVSCNRSYVLMVLVGDNGLRIPLMYMAIGPQDGATKQDCEINAAKRLFPLLFKEFPRTKFAFIMDALYTCEPIMRYLDDLGHLFVSGFKEGCTKSTWDDVQERLADSDFNNVVSKEIEVPPGRMYKGNTLYKRVSFVNSIKYKGLTLSCVKSEQSNMPHDTPSDTPELDQC